MSARKAFKELPVHERNIARALVEDLVLHGELAAGFNLQNVSDVLRLDKKSLASLKASVVRRTS